MDLPATKTANAPTTTNGKLSRGRRRSPRLASAADPAEVAAEVLNGCERDGLSLLRFWRGVWWFWIDGRYIELSDAEVRAQVLREFTRAWSAVRSRHISDVMEHLRARALLG